MIGRMGRAGRHYLSELFQSPNGGQRPSWWLLVGTIAVTMILVGVGVNAAATGHSQTNDFIRLQTDMGLVASDDFTGHVGTLPSRRMWNIRTGAGGWGNNEQQTYTASSQNVSLDGAGNLRITAREDGGRITSARVDTLGKLDTSTGLLAVRAKLPEGQGIHPAVWMLGSSLDVVGYPESGEIDLFEQANSRSNNSVGAIGPKTDLATKVPWKVQQQLTSAETGRSDDYHVYWVYRKPGLIQLGVDGRTVMRITPKDLPPQSVWVMDDPFFLILNVAVGGQWPGPVGAGALPAEMSVDWVRMYG
ncbi:glycoside hydrolase family 16 protein [Gordonia sp. CPCC 205515]|uniref:glycoside hydrolase family 16 protein n=1 Tax=Gordonia sp. CPCC 205515 TaxID=3140791 RepID=UPI003AF3DE13